MARAHTSKRPMAQQLKIALRGLPPAGLASHRSSTRIAFDRPAKAESTRRIVECRVEISEVLPHERGPEGRCSRCRGASGGRRRCAIGAEVSTSSVFDVAAVHLAISISSSTTAGCTDGRYVTGGTCAGAGVRLERGRDRTGLPPAACAVKRATPWSPSAETARRRHWCSFPPGLG